MSELEKKFEEFLQWAEVNNLIKLYKYKEMAEMLAEIVNKYERLFVLKILELEKENAKLKKEKAKNELENKREKQKEIYNLTGREVDLEDL